MNENVPVERFFDNQNSKNINLSLNFPPQFENISLHARSFLCYLTLPRMTLDSAHCSDRLNKVT